DGDALLANGMGLVATAELEWRTELADAQGQQDVAARSVERHDDAAHRATPPLLDERQLLEVHRWIRYEALRTYDIAVIAGDGIGPEVVAAGKRVLDGAAHGFSLRWHDLDWSCARYQAIGAMMPADGLAQLAPHDAIYLGAVGDPAVPDHVSLWGLLLPIRQAFQLYANVRPVRLLPGVPTVLSDTRPTDIDMVWIRENTEGEYAGVGGRLHQGGAVEVATQTSVFTRSG